MPSCDDCGLVFENMHDVQRHVKKWCPENDSKKRKLDEEEEESPPKKLRPDVSVDSDISDTEEDSSEEGEYFAKIRKKAKNNNDEKWSEKAEKYEANGLSKKEAENKADSKMEEADLMEFLNQYGQTILDIIQLRGGKLHTKVMQSVGKYLRNGYDKLPAVRVSLRKYKHELQEDMYSEDESEDDEESEDGHESDEDESEDGDSEDGEEYYED